MVTRWGMSERLGPLNLSEPDGTSPFAAQRPYSDATAELIDTETRRIVDECMQEAESLLRSHRAPLDALVRALLAEETIGEAEILRVTGLPQSAPTVVVAGAAVTAASVPAVPGRSQSSTSSTVS